MRQQNLFCTLIIAFSFACSSENPDELVVVETTENNAENSNIEPMAENNESGEMTFLVSDTRVQPWIVSASAVSAYLDTREAVLLDSRPRSAFDADPLDGFQHADWQAFSLTAEADRGELVSIDELAELFTQLGITEDKWVFVMGDPINGWGEDGRIVWMLRAMGHENVALIDGGYTAARQLVDGRNGEPKEEPSTEPTTMTDTTFEPSVSELELTAGAEDVLAGIDADEVELIDVREKREYDGETPYGESRGGHVPTAKHLHYKSLIDENGRLLSKEAILAALDAADIDSSKKLITYCTGGVRSGWLSVVLQAAGLDSENYAGSMWQWSSYDANDFPLE